MPLASLHRSARFAVAAAIATHAALAIWAAWAWIHGPFEGRGVVDGAEILAWARTGEPDAFATKSPLYPTLLRGAFALAGDSPWTVAGLGLVLSLATLAALVCAARELETPRAAPWAAWAWALSGSALAFSVQPVEALLAACLGAWCVALALRAERTRAASAIVLAVLCGGAAVLSRAPLLVGVLAVLVWLLRRGVAWRTLAASLTGAVLLAWLAFGARAWPEAGALNLRLANGGARSGTCELRPGPAYDALRYDETFDPRRAADPSRSGESIQLALLADEVSADPSGAVATLAAKALLFWQRFELVSDADFHHGFARFAAWPVLAWSFALVAPLALFGLALARCSRATPIALFALAVFATDVLFASASRYRFPALPEFALLAALFVVSRPARVRWGLACLVAGALAVDWTGRARPFGGDGNVQEAQLELETDRESPRARACLLRALELGRDPRARYDLALSYEHEHRRTGSLDALQRAAALYREALELEPRYAEASGNLLRVLLALGRPDEAARVGVDLAARDPRAGTLRGNLAAAQRGLASDADVRELEREAHRIEALRAWAQRAEALAREHARAARELGSDDPRVLWLLTTTTR
ncbi:MAG: tetratricopeptide repeat protein [Planctomycetes bacterium]|nr:tetratricopeptide repeat protein [Planctomycetota bacterium]